MSLSGGGDGRSAWLMPVTSAHQPIQRKGILQRAARSLDVNALIRAESYGESNTDLATAIAHQCHPSTCFGAGNNDLSESATAEEVIDAARDEFRKETACEGLWTDQLLDAARWAKTSPSATPHGIALACRCNSPTPSPRCRALS